MNIDVFSREERGHSIIAAKGRLDGLTADSFIQEVQRLIGDGKGSYILDFAEVPYLSSAGLRGILILAKQVRQAGGSLALSSPTPMVKDVFNMARLASVVPIFDALEDALASPTPPA